MLSVKGTTSIVIVQLVAITISMCDRMPDSHLTGLDHGETHAASSHGCLVFDACHCCPNYRRRGRHCGHLCARLRRPYLSRSCCHRSLNSVRHQPFLYLRLPHWTWTGEEGRCLQCGRHHHRDHVCGKLDKNCLPVTSAVWAVSLTDVPSCHRAWSRLLVPLSAHGDTCAADCCVSPVSSPALDLILQRVQRCCLFHDGMHVCHSFDDTFLSFVLNDSYFVIFLILPGRLWTSTGQMPP